MSASPLPTALPSYQERKKMAAGGRLSHSCVASCSTRGAGGEPKGHSREISMKRSRDFGENPFKVGSGISWKVSREALPQEQRTARFPGGAEARDGCDL